MSGSVVEGVAKSCLSRRLHGLAAVLAVLLGMSACVDSNEDGRAGESSSSASDTYSRGPEELIPPSWSDILLRNSSGEVRLWLMAGSSVVYSATVTGPGVVELAWQPQGVGDFNLDGLADILWRNTVTSEVKLWLMNVDTITGQYTLAAPGVVEAAWQVAGLGDFNGDSMSDIVWRNTSTGEVKLWLMNGSSIASQISVTGPGVMGLEWQIHGIGDFYQDGKSGLLWRNVTNGEVRVWRMSGGTILSDIPVVAPGVVGLDWQIKCVGDFDGNNKSDIAWRNTSGEVKVWLMSGANIATEASVSAPGAVGAEWVIQGVGDFNLDGKSDLAWRNMTTGEVKLWFMNGGNAPVHATVQVLDLSWQIKGVAEFGNISL